MSTIREFSLYDMLKFNNVNLDILTETYSTNFYGKYIAIWNEYNVAAQNSSGMIEAYIIGKVEGDKTDEKKKIGMGMYPLSPSPLILEGKV